MCNLYLCEVAHDVSIKGQSETTSLLLLLLTRIKLRTFNSPKPTLGVSHLMALG